MNQKAKGIIGILTGGGDVPGLNPAIRAVTIRALREGYKVIGIRRGWKGLVDVIRDKKVDNSCNYFELTEEIVNKAGRTGGTFLHSSRTRASHVPQSAVPEHLKDKYNAEINDLTPEVLKNLEFIGIDYLIPIGGDDTLSYAVRLSQEGVKVVAIPKTMDNDVPGTDYCAEALSAQQDSEAQKDSLFRFLKSTLSKQMGDTTVIVSTALEELSFLLYYHGCKMDFNEEYQIEENFPSLLGGAPCKGMRTFWIDEVDPENGSFRITSDAIVNTDQAIRQFIELIQSNLPEEDRRKPIDSSQIPIIMAQDQNDTYIHADTGWPLVVYYTRTTQVGENKSGQEISLEINIPE